MEGSICQEGKSYFLIFFVKMGWMLIREEYLAAIDHISRLFCIFSLAAILTVCNLGCIMDISDNTPKEGRMWKLMESYLFRGLETGPDTLIVEGWHKPGTLTRSSGAWIQEAGSAMLEAGEYAIKARDQWVWFAVEDGTIELTWHGRQLELKVNQTCFLPADSDDAYIRCSSQCRCLWISLEGPLSPMVVRKMGALLHMPLKQGALPSQIYLAKQIVQVMVRHSGTGDATYQLQHLLYGMLASHWGQPVAMDAMLSHEIAKVVDTLRANQYRDNFSLQEMASISRMPMETFRKRFVSEVGMPPLSYVLHCKMERAKELLRDPDCTVRQAGIEVGMQDPYHFSKQFKNIVGISPSAFMKQAAMSAGDARDAKKKKA